MRKGREMRSYMKLERDLTKGSVVKQLIMFALPFMLSNLIQSFYNVADMYIVGKFCGPAGISAVNIGGQVTFLMTNLVVGLCVGGTVIVAQYLGNDRRKEVVECIGTLLVSLLGAAVVITVVMLFISTQILNLIQTPEESFAQAREYLDITIMGTLFIFGYNALSAIMRGMGDSRRPLYFVTIACALNIVLDYILVGGFGMEAKGAAIATVFSQGVSMALCVIYLKTHDFVFDFKLKSFRFYPHHFKVLMKVGVPTSIQNVISNFSFLVLTTIANQFGVAASAGLAVVGKYNGFAIMPTVAVGSSISAMAAQNIGAGQLDRAKKTLHTGLLLAYAVSVPIFLLSQLFPEQIIGIFDKDPAMLEAGAQYLKSFSFDYLCVALVFCVNGIITGSGHTAFASISNILSSVGFRIPMALLFGIVLDGGMRGLGLAAPIASLATTVLVLIFYFSGRWKVSTIIKAV